MDTKDNDSISIQNPVTRQAMSEDEVPIIVGQPLPDPSPLPHGNWKDGLCDCCSQCSPSCCLATWCPCILLGQIYQKLNQGKCVHVVAAFVAGYLLYSILLVTIPQAANSINGIIAIGLFVLTCALRGTLRRQMNIQGSDCDDCCVSFWCQCCALAQMARQLHDYRRSWAGCPLNETGNPDHFYARPNVDHVL